jgi:hypothetical protein
MKEKIAKLPKWAQSYIQELEQRCEKAEIKARASAVAADAVKIKKDVPPPEDSFELSKGWLAFSRKSSAYYPVTKACSSCVSHGVGNWEGTNSQRPIWLYSTPQLALYSLFYEIREHYLEDIANIQRYIEEYDG